VSAFPAPSAGLALAHEKYGSGKFTLAQLIAPAIKLARGAFAVDDELADTLPRAQPRLARWLASAKIFLKGDGVALGRGDTLAQTDLATSLKAIANGGSRAFYEGTIAVPAAPAGGRRAGLGA
jgi:gamma-glutamyltranspeptidase / glutathione hydrolase